MKETYEEPCFELPYYPIGTFKLNSTRDQDEAETLLDNFRLEPSKLLVPMSLKGKIKVEYTEERGIDVYADPVVFVSGTIIPYNMWTVGSRLFEEAQKECICCKAVLKESGFPLGCFMHNNAVKLDTDVIVVGCYGLTCNGERTLSLKESKTIVKSLGSLINHEPYEKANLRPCIANSLWGDAALMLQTKPDYVATSEKPVRLSWDYGGTYKEFIEQLMMKEQVKSTASTGTRKATPKPLLMKGEVKPTTPSTGTRKPKPKPTQRIDKLLMKEKPKVKKFSHHTDET